MQVNELNAAAIEKFVLKVSIPIFLENGKSGGLHATGTLFKISGRSFIITARHVFDGLNDKHALSRLAYPEKPFHSDLYTLGQFNLLRPSDKHLDVAAVELLCPETIGRLEENWRFLGLENVAAPSVASSDGKFFVAGYPVSLTSVNKAGWTQGKLATAYTVRLPDVPVEAEPPVTGELDLFFDYGHDAKSVTGELVKTPELPGVSGASVWELKPVQEIWTPEAATRVVGIQSSYIHSKYFRAKSWWAVARLLEEADESLAHAIRTNLNEL